MRVRIIDRKKKERNRETKNTEAEKGPESRNRRKRGQQNEMKTSLRC
jgi:hypothetical protein